jgi:hypothetical protein
MDPAIARANEAVVVALRRLRPELRFVGTKIEAGVRRVCLIGGTPGAWKDVLASLDHAEIVKADSELAERPLTPTTALGWKLHLRDRRRKVNIPREPWP